MTAAFTVIAALCYFISLKKDKAVFAFIGGVACGISALTKPNGAIVGIAIVAWHFISNIENLFKKEYFLKVIFDKKLLLFFLGCFVGAGYWYLKVTAQYGSPVYKPRQANILATDQTGWFKMLRSRPKYLYFLGIPYQNPLFALAYIAPIWLFFEKKKFKELLFPIVWLAVTYLLAYRFFRGEHRFMLPSYAAYAILGAYVANKIRLIVDKQLGKNVGIVFLLMVLIVSAVWSIPMGLDVVFTNGALIMKPF